MSGADHLASSQVDLDVADLEPGRIALGRPAELRADPRQQLIEVEGLGDVVVGAAVQAVDDVLLLTERGQQDHRQLGPAGTDGLEDLEPRALGQAEIEEHELEVAGEGEPLALLSIARQRHREALGLERSLEEFGDSAFIFDDEDAHAEPS